MEEVLEARTNVLIVKTLIFFLSMLLTALIGCSNPSGDAVKIIIPNNFRGVFKIVPDEEGTLAEKKDEHFVFRIPGSGILRVKNTDPFKDFHETVVEYESGKSVPAGILDLDEDSIAYYYLWSDTADQIWFLIGTTDQYQSSQKEGRVQVGKDFLKSKD